MRSLLISSLVFCAATSLVAAERQPTAIVQPLTAVSQLLIPAAGSTAGANGTFFRSDITIANFAIGPQNVRLQWLPQSGAGSTVDISVPGRTALRSDDFVREFMHQSGLGAILVTGMTPAGMPDPTAQLYVSTRIWTPQPGTDGTTSQSLPAVATANINTPRAAILGAGALTHPENFRVNVGIVNLDPNNAQTFALTFPQQPGNPTAATVTVAPMSMQQVPLGSGLLPLSEILISNTTDAATRSNNWVAYGSNVDNITGDAWSELAVVGLGQ